ncbi:MAG TPA: hypothetical protein VF190_11390 [Rhodothermales bacterium]
MRTRPFMLVFVATLMASPLAVRAQDHTAHMQGANHAEHSAMMVPLYDNLGDHHFEISTSSEEAQKYFDQGIRLTYAFNHDEAIRAFKEAARLDPNCAMCYWGIALAHGPNINLPMDSTNGVAAWEALQEALARREHANERERAYIDALAVRYQNPPPADRAALDTAYANAMGMLAAADPNDLEAATLHAEALMDLSPWYYWEKDGMPRPDTPTILENLERVIAANPNHPGACHFYIHAVEAAEAEKGVACAERLAALMPGAGHLVHMPAHIYIRVGRWNDAIEMNHHATHADETYIADQRPGGVYPVSYYPHNYHFLAFAASMAGRSTEAIEAARNAAQRMPLEGALLAHELEGIVPYEHLTLVRFGRWDDVLALPMPPAELDYATGLVQYARGVAFAATGKFDEANAAVEALQALSAKVEKEPGNTVLSIAEHALMGEIASRRGDLEEGITHLRIAADIEDSLIYIEPPFWYYPMRHALGAVLLDAGRAAEAEAAYREDLKRFPGNGWSLAGLAASLRAQGRGAEAAEVEAERMRTWDQADVDLATSRF